MNLKSQQSIESARVLIKNKMYNASVHCLYYAVFQYVKYVLNSYSLSISLLPLSYNQQDSLTSRANSHKAIFQELISRIKIIDGNDLDSQLISQKIDFLKSKRILGDYKLGNISKKECFFCKKETLILIETIKNKFCMP